jgi:ribonuclease P protein component
VEIPQRQPHALKLTHATEFRATLAAECRLSGKSFLLRAGANTLPGARLGLIASRKAARRAVDRNRGKRLAREAFRAAHSVHPGLPAVDVVLQLKNDLRKTGNRDLRKELDRLLREVAARFGVAAIERPLPIRPQSE